MFRGCPAAAMWRSLTKGFRERFKRGINLNQNNPCEPQRTEFCSNCSNKTTCVPEVTSYLAFYQRHRCKEDYNNDGTNKEQKSYGAFDPFDTWLGAVSCSSAFALGWVLSEPSHWRRWFRECRSSQDKRNYCSLTRILAKVAVAQPPLPPVSPVQEAIESNVQYGPPTADEALSEAAANFLKVHNSIYGEVENKKAIALIEGPKKDERKAIKLFYSASKKGYVPALYNLGQCYELGIGTKQDFYEAAKWYQKAADAGHPTATYNLAVFHAHGWGGLSANSGKARDLLKAAAALGQPDAAAALGISKDSLPSTPIPGGVLIRSFSKPISNDIPEEIRGFNDLNVPPLQEISCDPEEIYRLASNFENRPCDDSTQPHLVLQLYKMASDLGHKEAKVKYNILRSYDSVGLLSEYLCRGSKPTSSFDSFSNMRFPTIV